MTGCALMWRAERACRNAWPALRSIWLDDWQLRLGEGLTRRANSANPLCPDYHDSSAIVAACEAFYSRHNQPAIFRLPTIIDSALDRRLAARGYNGEGDTLVLYADAAGITAASESAVQLFAEPSTEWFAAMGDLQGYSDRQSRTYRRIVGALAVPAVFALLVVEGEPAAIAYGAISEALLCVESVVADRRRLRRGFARRVVSSLLTWGGEQGVEGVCLEVEATNLSALALYDRIGLKTELYRYHYRRQSPVRG
jgi:N-acetylglutamate synthase